MDEMDMMIRNMLTDELEGFGRQPDGEEIEEFAYMLAQDGYNVKGITDDLVAVFDLDEDVAHDIALIQYGTWIDYSASFCGGRI